MKSFIIVLAFLCPTSYNHALNLPVQQIATANSILAQNAEATINTLYLDTLQGKIIALYSKNYKVRAQTIQSLVEKCVSFYQPKFPETRFDLQIMILDKDDWNKTSVDGQGPPYGMPSSNPQINKLFIAADKNAVSKLFGAKSDDTPDNTLSTPDCIALHELGHIFLLRYNDTHTQMKWADEFLASYFAICFFQQHKSYPGLPQENRPGYQPKYKTLSDFERLYSNVGAQNYGWYQGKFQELAKRLYPKFKVELIREFITNYSATGKKLEPLVLLKQLAPEITNEWLEEMK